MLSLLTVMSFTRNSRISSSISLVTLSAPTSMPVTNGKLLAHLYLQSYHVCAPSYVKFPELVRGTRMCTSSSENRSRNDLERYLR